MPRITTEKFKCPEPGCEKKRFKNEWGLTVHHGRIHGPNASDPEERSEISRQSSLKKGLKNKKKRKEPNFMFSQVPGNLTTNHVSAKEFLAAMRIKRDTLSTMIKELETMLDGSLKI